MNDNTQMTSTPGSSLIPDGTMVITTMHLAIMAIFAVLVVIGILWGIRLKRRRTEAAKEVAQDNRMMDNAAPAVPAIDTPAPDPIVRDPIAPAPIADEPVAATAPLDASPATEAAAAAPRNTQPETPQPDAPTRAADAIPVTTLKGLGPKVAARLAELGITDAAQLAALDDASAAALDAQLGSFAGRMERDRWIEQARLLTAGDTAGYETIFGKL